MAAPTTAARVKKNPCQPGAVHTWPDSADLGALQQVVTYLRYIGREAM